MQAEKNSRKNPPKKGKQKEKERQKSVEQNVKKDNERGRKINSEAQASGRVERAEPAVKKSDARKKKAPEASNHILPPKEIF
jgi:hypothetical protein